MVHNMEHTDNGYTYQGLLLRCRSSLCSCRQRALSSSVIWATLCSSIACLKINQINKINKINTIKKRLVLILLVLVFPHQIKIKTIHVRIDSTVKVIQACIFILWSVLEVTVPVPPTCTIKTSRTAGRPGFCSRQEWLGGRRQCWSQRRRQWGQRRG